MSAPSTPQNVIARGVASNAFSFVIRFGAKASLLYIGARLYGAANYGVFTMATALIELAVPVASLGLKRMIFPWLEDRSPERAPGHIFLDAMLLAASTGIAVTALVIALALLLPGAFLSDQLRFSLAVIAPAIIGQSVSDIALAITRWKQRMRYEVIGRGIIEPYAAAGVALLAWFGGMHSFGLVLGYWCGTACLVAFALYSVRHCLGPLAAQSWRPHIADIRSRIRNCASVSLNDVINGLSQRLDFYLVGFWLGDAQAGNYSVLRELRTPLLHIRNAFDSMLIPIVARTMRFETDAVTGAAVAAATRLIVTLQVLVVLVMIFYGRSILGFFGMQYVDLHAVLVLLIIAQMISTGLSVSDLIIYFRRPSRTVVNNLITIAAMALFMSYGVRFGLIGVGWSVLAAACIGALVRRYWLLEMGIRHGLFHVAMPILAAAIAVAAHWPFRHALAEGVPQWVEAIAVPILPVAIYALLVGIWIKRNPEAVSLAKFRINLHEET